MSLYKETKLTKIPDSVSPTLPPKNKQTNKQKKKNNKNVDSYHKFLPNISKYLLNLNLKHLPTQWVSHQHDTTVIQEKILWATDLREEKLIFKFVKRRGKHICADACVCVLNVLLTLYVQV